MINLLVCTLDAGEDTGPITRFGGKPCAPSGRVAWPICKTCKGNMQFLGQVAQEVEQRLVLLFMCQNQPGLCDEWDANGGGNQVIVVPAHNATLVEPPIGGATLRETHHDASVTGVLATDYEGARKEWPSAHGVSPRQVLGQIGGVAAWLQADETPTCNVCGISMRFLAQLEEGPEQRSAMNFGGGGSGYIFQCLSHPEQARFLFQS